MNQLTKKFEIDEGAVKTLANSSIPNRKAKPVSGVEALNSFILGFDLNEIAVKSVLSTHRFSR